LMLKFLTRPLLRRAGNRLAISSFLLSGWLAGAGDWPQWRGPHRDGHADETLQLTSLPREVKPLWKVSIGTGFSSPIVVRSALYYADQQESRETFHRVDSATGKELWKVSVADSVGDEWGKGPRSTPFADGDRVYFQSMNGEFRCFNAEDGKVRWGFAFKDYGIEFLGGTSEGTATRRGNNGSGIIDGNFVYVPVGARGASVVCFDKLTGKEIWKALNDEAAYSSFVVATLAGVKQLVVFTADALAGLDLQTGKQLWRVPYRTNAKRHASTPVINGDTVTVNSHSIGLVCSRIEKRDGALAATQLWADKQLTINIATPVLVDGFLYTFGAVRTKNYVCVDASNGAVKWSQPGFGIGKDQTDYASTIVIGKTLLILTYDGQLVLAAADPMKYTELGRLQVCGKTWSYPALAHGKLYVRDSRELQSIDLAAGNVASTK
jgi:outer membrane protein assembly factor BamB